MHLRSENAPLCGRDHLSYRSYFFPVKVSFSFDHKIHVCILHFVNLSPVRFHARLTADVSLWLNEMLLHIPQNVIDGDLCEQFNSMESSKRRNIAEELDRTPAEVCLLMIKNRVNKNVYGKKVKMV